MNTIAQGVLQALQLIFDCNPEVWNITALSVKISGIATIISVIIGIPSGVWLALKNFQGKQLISSMLNCAMGLPPVVAGLIVSIFLWRYGIFGSLGLMYTQTAMTIAQVIISYPIIAGLAFAAILSVEPKLYMQLLSMGADTKQATWLIIKEARLGLTAAIIAGFGRVISEVGAAMMVGGNIIKGETRVLTTATVLEVGKGNYDMALALSFILLLLAYSVVLLLTYLQHSGKSRIQ